MCEGIEAPPYYQADSTLIKKKKNFTIYMGFLKYGEMHKYLVIYDEAFGHIRLCTRVLPNFLIYEENFVFFPFSAVAIPQSPSKTILHWSPSSCMPERVKNQYANRA